MSQQKRTGDGADYGAEGGDGLLPLLVGARSKPSLPIARMISKMSGDASSASSGFRSLDSRVASIRLCWLLSSIQYGSDTH